MRILFDVTTTARTVFAPPVGTTRVERLILADLYNRLGAEGLTFVNFDAGRYVFMSAKEVALLEELIVSPLQQACRTGELKDADQRVGPDEPLVEPPMTAIRRFRIGVRRLIERYPKAYRPEAVHAAAQVYIGLRSFYHVSRAAIHSRTRSERQALSGSVPAEVVHSSKLNAAPFSVDFSEYTDLITIGNGWDYLDYTYLWMLKRHFGLRVHGFAHDLIAVNFPYFFHDPKSASSIHQHYTELCHVCDTLVCNSNATADSLRDFIAFENLPQPKIAVAQLPVFESQKLIPKRPESLPDGDFVMFVSTIEIRKNHRILLNLWRECLHEQRQMPKLVFIGRIGWGVDRILDMVRFDPLLREHIVILHDVTDAQLLWLYDNCLFTVYPSIVEGWGLPIGEALGRGRICLHSTDPAQREAAQNLMPAIHPDDFYGWKTAVLDLIERPARRQRLEQAVRDRFQPIGRDDFCARFREAIEL